EDDPSTLLLITQYLNMKGLNSKGLPKSQDVFETIYETKPRVIFLDISLPGMNGFDICKKLKEDDAFKNIPVYYITAMPRAEIEAKLKETKADGFILKPFDLNDLDEIVNKYFNS
ncbi:MAG: response regulator, partial [Promethearchaeota archaeon]